MSNTFHIFDNFITLNFNITLTSIRFIPTGNMTNDVESIYLNMTHYDILIDITFHLLLRMRNHHHRQSQLIEKNHSIVVVTLITILAITV